MNVIKMILIIGAILGLVALAATPAMAQTIEYTGNGPGNSWHELLNWDQNRVPNSTDDVVIPLHVPAYTVVISSQDAACKTLDIEERTTLEITGKTLTLGDSGGNTTSNLDFGGEFADGTIRFVKSGSNIGILKVHQTVTFTGGGTIDARNSNEVGRIERASGTGGIVISDAGGGLSDNKVIGNITLFCNVTNNGEFFGTIAGQTMVFGSNDLTVDPEPTISGTGVFLSSGKIQFTIVSFASTAPKWAIQGGEIEVTDDANDTHWVDVPFDIDMTVKDGLLDLKHDFSCIGTLTVSTNANRTNTITVASGKTAEIKPASP